jgi:cell division protein FtsI/penicillin-binding protein 2
MGWFLWVFLAGTLPSQAAVSLQDFVNDLMRNRRGSVLVADPRTGLLLASWNSRQAFASAWPPGSTAKLFTAAAALEEGLISPSEETWCRRVPELLGEAYHCSHPAPEEPFTLASALANSCNYFFTRLSLRLRPTQLEHWFEAFGLGSPPGRVLIGMDDAGKARAALGEGGVTVSSAQLLMAYSAFANRGTAYRLSRRKPGVDRAAAGRAAPSDPAFAVRLRSETLKVLSAGLEGCVQFGTCGAAAVEGVRIAGKTGTATALDGSGVTHAWFAGYAPVDQPEIVLVVFLERGTGQHDAAPLAGKIFKFCFARVPLGLRPTQGSENPNARRPPESGDPGRWIPAFAGMKRRE